MTTPSPVYARPDRWRLLSRYREGERTLAEWKSIFEGFPPEDYPLVKIEGSRANSIVCPDSGYALAIYANQDGSYSATPPPDSECDSWIDGLTLEELRLYRLDWPALCRSVAAELGIPGASREMPCLPWFWRLGELGVNSHRLTCYFAVLRQDADSVLVAEALRSDPAARLIVASLSDYAFARLTAAKIECHALTDGTPPNFTVPPLPTADNAAPSIAGKLDVLSVKTDQVLQHVSGVPPLVEKAVEALANPMAAADELRRRWPLTTEESRIREAIIAHGGTGKGAARALGLSEPTVSRARVRIRQKMLAAGYPAALVFRPSQGHKVHVTPAENPKDQPIIDYQAPADDWQDDPDSRRRIIRDYKAASESDKAAMREHFKDIEAEAGEE